MTWTPWLAVVLALFLFWTVGAYNRLIRLRSAVLQAFGALDTFYVRWIALAGDCQSAPQGAGDAPDAARAAVQAATSQFGASLAVARAQPLDGNAIAARGAGAQALESAWLSLMDKDAPQGATPDQQLWARQREGLRQQTLPTLQAFNAAVERYNAAIAQFPASVLAWLFGFRKTQSL